MKIKINKEWCKGFEITTTPRGIIAPVRVSRDRKRIEVRIAKFNSFSETERYVLTRWCVHAHNNGKTLKSVNSYLEVDEAAISDLVKNFKLPNGKKQYVALCKGLGNEQNNICERAKKINA